MAINFEFSTAGKIFFGTGKAANIPSIALEYGLKIMIVSGQRRTPALLNLLQGLTDKGAECTHFTIAGEPTIELAEAGALIARQKGCEIVIGFGGGSSLDTAKAIAALATNPPPAMDYLEVIGKGKPLLVPPLPIIAVPTTAGTGTEVTRNAVLASTQAGVKVSLRHVQMIPKVAIIDPELTIDMPAAITAATGMDALTQLVEPFLSNGPTPITDAICADGIQRIGRSLRVAYDQPSNIDAREEMALAALLSGMALANAKLGAVHGFAGPIGGMFGAPHGMLCARLLPFVYAENMQALADSKDHRRRFDQIGAWVTGDPASTGQDAMGWMLQTTERLQIPSLREHGVTTADFPRIISAAKNASSMKGNPVTFNDEQMTHILEQAL